MGLTYCYSREVNKDISFINEFKGLFFKYPLLSLSLAVSLFSMAGIPPLMGFFSKQLVLYSALIKCYKLFLLFTNYKSTFNSPKRDGDPKGEGP